MMYYNQTQQLVETMVSMMLMAMGVRMAAPIMLQSIPTRQYCGKKNRHLFEEAAVAHFGEDSALAAKALWKAQSFLYRCLGIKEDIEVAFGETERWFSFFQLWWTARLIEKDKTEIALVQLKDQEESYGPHARQLGILKDYGCANTKKLYSLTRDARIALERGNTARAIRLTNEVANFQYRLAVERAGTTAPGPQEV